MPIMIFESSKTQLRKKIKIGEVTGKQSYHQEINSDRAAEIPSSDDDVVTTLSLFAAAAAIVPENINTDHHHHHHHHHREVVMMINLAKFRNENIEESSNFLGLGINSDDHKSRVEIKMGDDDDDAKHDDDQEVAACHDFLKEAPEDILLEIFIRLPNSRSAIRSAIVCHNWRSLISHNPRFIPRFISHHHQHQHRYPLPYTILFRKADKRGFAGPQYFQPICKLFSEDSTFCTSPNFLDFLPSSMVIRGSCNDLLLVSPGPRWSPDLYICNPITKQYIQLPEISRPLSRDNRRRGKWYHVAGYALVCMPGGPTNKFRFKVVEIHPPYILGSDYDPVLPVNVVQTMKVFCSESRKWKFRRFEYRRTKERYNINWLHAVACNGILYWLEYERGGVDRIISLDLSLDDLSNRHCGVIDFPDDSYNEPRYDIKQQLEGVRAHIRDQIGVVRVHGGEELRLIQVVLSTGMELTVDLKVWKLSYNPDEKKDWVLVHHKNKLKKPNKTYEGLPFVHPTNGDVVFMVWGQHVYQYNLKDDTAYEMIGKLQEPLMFNTGYVPSMDLLLPFPVVLPNWPTQILA